MNEAKKFVFFLRVEKPNLPKEFLVKTNETIPGIAEDNEFAPPEN